MVGKAFGRQIDRRDDFIGPQISVNVRRVSWQAVKIAEWNRPRAVTAAHLHQRVESRQSDAHIRRVDSDALLVGAQYRVHSIDPADGRTAGAGLAFIAGRGEVVKVYAARSL